MMYETHEAPASTPSDRNRRMIQGRRDMASFDPTPKYTVVPSLLSIKDFRDYSEEYVVRPPYQRKTVWSRKKQQDLLDSLLRRYYVPRIVLRQVRLDESRIVKEVIDGQQRITTVQAFFNDELTLPARLTDLVPQFVGKTYSQLDSAVRRFFDRLNFDVDEVVGINDPRNPEHQGIATEIFWRLQQGESLNYMEVAHSRLSSLARNFVVKYADDQSFDYDLYQPIDENPHKHNFFRVIDRGNDRMQHLALATRFLILEKNNGPTDLSNADVETFIEQHQQKDGIGSHRLESETFAKNTLATMNSFYAIFRDDPMVTNSDGMKEFKTEYFIISIYLLLRHLTKHYVWGEAEQNIFRDFTLDFHPRWRSTKREEDRDILAFSDARQQSGTEVAIRDRIIRQLFFEYVREHDHEIIAKDTRRAFNEADRIAIYRRHDGLCQMCLAEGRAEHEALVPWREYQADHVLPHALGGRTRLDNAQVLCRQHNTSKGARPADVGGSS